MKRKHEDTFSFPAEQRLSSGDSLESIDAFRVSLETLESTILESKSGLNEIGNLLGHARASNTARRCAAMACACRVFFRVLNSEKITTRLGSSDSDAVILRWLQERFEDYLKILIDSIKASDLQTGLLALDLYMESISAWSERSAKPDPVSIKSRLAGIIVAILESANGNRMHNRFAEQYACKYADIREFTYRCLRDIPINPTTKDSLDQRISFLTALGCPSADNVSSDHLVKGLCKPLVPQQTICVQQREAGDTWLYVLSQSLSGQQRKLVLKLMTQHIAPTVVHLERLSDFLDESFRIGGATSLMALSGLFHLIREKNLDYPDFYEKLYGLLGPETLHSKHRSRFLRLLETFLSSSHLPSTLIASFIKRLCRLCLNSPPSAIVVVVPFIYNLLKSHPACTFMIHRERNEGSIETQARQDPYKMHERDPLATEAIRSSLWEIETLQKHFHPNVATLCNIISEQFTKQEYNLEDFLDHSYSSMIESELSRDVHKTPVVEHHIPKKVLLFNGEKELPPMLGCLWRFGA